MENSLDKLLESVRRLRKEAQHYSKLALIYTEMQRNPDSVIVKKYLENNQDPVVAEFEAACKRIRV